MAIPKKGSRRIVVRGESYRWLIRRKATYGQSDYGNGYINVAVEHENEQGAVLIIYTSNPHPKDWSIVEIDPVTPRNIEEWIVDAISKGGQPKIPGAQFNYEA